MKQKLGLACALLRSPPLLLLDEPTVGVDPLSRRELWAILRRLVEREAVSVLLSTAYLDEAQRCDEVAVLHGGRLLEQGPPDRFRGRAEGGTFLLRCPAGAKRALRRRAAESPAVLDALVQADGVRVVLRTSDAAELRSSLAGGGDVTVEPVEPRFEDGFVMMLGERGPLEAQAAPQPPPAEAAPPPAAARDGETVIEAASLVRKFGDFYAVREVSFQVRRGEVFALLGPNGAGKSTTFRMLCGLLPATAGVLRVAGVNLRRAPAAARARIGYVSQKFSLYAGLSVRENLRFFSSAYGLWGRSRRRQIERMLGEFHLAAFAEAASGSLPPGYQQRLAMACALMHEPEILFLDEPTSGVDVLARREFWGRINALAERGVTVMVTTHYMEEAEYCDRLAIMSGGRVLAIGPPAEIRDAARGGDLPAPSMEDAFVRLIAGQQRREGER